MFCQHFEPCSFLILQLFICEACLILESLQATKTANFKLEKPACDKRFEENSAPRQELLSGSEYMALFWMPGRFI